MIMKKQIISWGMMLAAAFTLTNCAKEIEGPAQEPETNGYPFEIVASTVDTKTVNDGMATKWVDGDKINLFHAEADGTVYQNDADFTVADVDAGRFTGKLSSALETGKKYDWYAIYPYSSNITTPGEREAGYTYIGHRNGLNQSGYNSTAALDGNICPFYGVAKSVDANTTPSIDMKHLTSVVAINVTNTTNTPVTITTASLTATEDIVGSYYIDITGSSVTYNPSEGYVEKTATVNVSGGTALATGESAILYLAIKPFTAAEGTNLMLSVNGLEKTLELPNDVEFYAGKIKTLNFKYDAENVEVPAISVADFMELEDGPKVYELTGVITGIYQAYNSQYGNISFYITDDTGTVLIFRMTCDDILANAITVGDEITVRGSKTTHSSTAQMAEGGVYVSHRDGCATPVISCSENMVTITSEDGAKVYYTTDGTDPTTSSTPYTAPFAITETNTVKAIAVADGKLTSLVASRVCEYIEPSADSATDVLTLATTGVSGTSYTEWSGKTVSSSAVYAGQSAGGKESIQLRSNNNNSGIITTSSGGNLKKIVVNWHSETAAGRTLQVYGKSSAYNAPTDLYGDSKGELLGTIVKGTTTELNVEGNYQYVGLRSASGAMYLLDISITWDTTGEGETPTIQPRNLAFSAATATATVGQPFTAPTLNGVTTGVTYTSSNESVATVNAETGAVTLVGAGTTTIKASAPATAEYEAGEASYTLTVSAAVVDDTEYPGTYAIVALRGEMYYYLTNVAATGSRLTAVQAGTSLPADNVSLAAEKVWNIEKVGNKFALKSVETDEYISWTSGTTATMETEGIAFEISETEGTYVFKYAATDADRYLSLNKDTYDYFAVYKTGQIANLYLIPAVVGEEAVPELTGITVNATKTTFTVGDEFAFAGTVTANYSNGTTKTVTDFAAFSGYNMSQEGLQTITVTYEGKTATYDITVNPAQSGGNAKEYVEMFSSYTNTSTSNSVGVNITGDACDWTGVGVTTAYWSNFSWGNYTTGVSFLKPATNDSVYIESEELSGGITNLSIAVAANATTAEIQVSIINIDSNKEIVLGTVHPTSKKTKFSGEWDVTGVTGKYKIKITNHLGNKAYLNVTDIRWN